MKLTGFVKTLKSKLFAFLYDRAICLDDLLCTLRIRRLERKRRNPGVVIKVGFIVHMPEVWNKEAPIYESMVSDPRFDPWLIVPPSRSSITLRLDDYEKLLNYYSKMYPNAKILTRNELGEDCAKLRKQRFDYVFFQRSWESSLPKKLRTRNVLRYAKTCYVPYAFHCFQDRDGYYKTRFFSSIYVMFCCSEQQKEIYHASGGRKAEFIGFPGLCRIEPSAPSAEIGLRILWTPRWTTSSQYGGTTFFDYKDKFIPFKQAHPDVRIIFRPHPLTFEDAVRTNRMTAEDIDRFKRQNEAAGILFDENADVDQTLKSIDVMITDFTSVIIDAFLSGKILIYCGKKTDETPSEMLQQILACSYRAETWEKVEAALEMLGRGEDPMRDARRSLAKTLIQAHRNSDQAILQYIADDYHQ